MSWEQSAQKLGAVCQEVERKVVGQSQAIRFALAAFVAGGHVLLEDVPGTGKTTLANSLATVLGLEFHRVQGTPDLLPSEVVGTMVFHPGTSSFTFRQGPVFTQLLLMDEINRATPRTQSALLEAMAEHSVTVDGNTYPLKSPFFVIATANPIENQGVFPLPEAQLNRFLIQLRLGYTSEADELEMVRRVRLGQETTLNVVMSGPELLQAQNDVRQVTVTEEVLQYIVRLCRATREMDDVILGASPRAVLALTAFAQALALLSNRNYVTPDDVRAAWIPVMRHRIRTEVDWGGAAEADAVEALLTQVYSTVPVPTEFPLEV